ncbi:MAG TPA: baseplate J/gp47 family protein [Polyangiaceae bacterium]
MTALQAAGVPSNTWRVGGPMRTLMRIIAASIVAMWTVLVAMISGGFLETASGNWLTFLAYYVYGVIRVAATQAQGTVTLVNAGGGVFDADPGKLILQNPTTKKTYVNVATLHLGANATLTDVAIVAQETGSASTTASGTVLGFVTPWSQVTATTTTDVVGLDAQNDDDLKATCMSHLGALSMLGPRDAYAYAIRTANDNGVPVNINRRSITRTSTTGTVGVICASPSGAPSAGDLTAVATNIEAVARPDTVTVTTNGATVVASAQTITVWAIQTAGLDAPSLTTMVQDAVAELVSAYPIGGLTKPPSAAGFLFASDMSGAAKDAHAAIYAIDGFEDIALSAGQVASVTVAVTVRFVQSAAA